MKPEEIIQHWEAQMTEQVINPVAQVAGMRVNGKYLFETPFAPSVKVVCSASLVSDSMTIAVVLDGAYEMPPADWENLMRSSGWRVMRVPVSEFNDAAWIWRLKNRLATIATPWSVSPDDPLAFERLGLHLPTPRKGVTAPHKVEDRKTIPRAHERWSEMEGKVLLAREGLGWSAKDIAALLQRTEREVTRVSRRLAAGNA